MRPAFRTPTALSAAFAAILLLAGCSSMGADGAGLGDSGGAAPAPGLVAEDAVDAADGDSAGDDADQALVITGMITITAKDPIIAAERASSIATAAGGRVDARQQYAPRDGDTGSATLTLRIPASALEKVRAQLGELGRVDETATEAANVGTRVRDLETRISTLRTSIGRYTAWLAAAQKTSDLIELEQAISERQNELESLEAQQRELADRVAMSTITLELRSESLAPPPDGPSDFWSATVLGWNAFVGFWAAVLVAVGVGLPWLVLIGLGVVLVLWLVRRSARRPAPAAAAPPLSGPDASES